MKTIKFLSFAMLLSLAWVACKNTASTDAQTTGAEAVADSTFISNKNLATMNLTGLREGVQIKIGDLEAGLATADAAGKATITTEVDMYKKFIADLDAVS